MYVYIYIIISILSYAYPLPSLKGEACRLLVIPVPIRTPVVLLHLYEILVYRSLGSLALEGLLWDSPCSEAGHGVHCSRDPTTPLPLFVAVCRYLSIPRETTKNNTAKYPKSSENHNKTGFVQKCAGEPLTRLCT